MASEQATAAAGTIGNTYEIDETEAADIIDAAFASVLALLKGARGIHRLTLRMEHTRDTDEYDKADADIKAIHDKIDALIGKEEP